jgi:lipopolysaccharide transport system ATP-binding protein
MSDDIAICVKGLGKKYVIGENQEKCLTVRDAITNSLKKPFQHLEKRTTEGDKKNDFWALKDVSFEVKKGEVIGIIGRNGAGKSTLLKILSRIVTPTEGVAEIHGRLGSLLEVGTGFHPELTGRENIFLSGSILGMKRCEIDEKFDEIVKFSEIEKFLDTPVKRYSSGMYVRLAFAVAAHMDTEILLVDEVLAVGDAAFQKKCLGKMGDVATKERRTVLFVSHNMGAVASLCTRGILIADGSIIVDGPVNSVLSTYSNNYFELNGVYENVKKNILNKKLLIQKIELLNGNTISTHFLNSDALTVRIEFLIKERIFGAQIAIELFSQSGTCILCSTSQDWNELKEEFLPGSYAIDCPLDLTIFRKGYYSIKVTSSIPTIEMLDIVVNNLMFEILNDPNFILQLGQGRNGMIMPLIKWSPAKCK